jgi:dynein heavy chain
MTYSQLYGNFDSISQEFTNGVIGTTFKNCVTDKHAADFRRWIIFDGPVEPIWIEDLNTLLDENRILCLMN